LEIPRSCGALNYTDANICYRFTRSGRVIMLSTTAIVSCVPVLYAALIRYIPHMKSEYHSKPNRQITSCVHFRIRICLEERPRVFYPGCNCSAFKNLSLDHPSKLNLESSLPRFWIAGGTGFGAQIVHSLTLNVAT